MVGITDAAVTLQRCFGPPLSGNFTSGAWSSASEATPSSVVRGSTRNCIVIVITNAVETWVKVESRSLVRARG